MALRKLMQIIVLFLEFLENFVKILKDSDKNLKPLLDWKLKKEWNRSILIFYKIIINFSILYYTLLYKINKYTKTKI